jgi:uncharacterized membrane protein (UPF0182 family)
MPELRLVVLAVQDRLAYGPTFEAAMAALLGGADSSLTVQSSISTPSSVANTAGAPAGNTPPEDLDALIKEAARDLSDYQQLTASGKLADAGQKLEELKHTLEELQRRRH